MYRKDRIAIGEYYHIYNRGVEKRSIFLDEADYNRFQRLLYICNSTRKFKYRDIANKSFPEIDRDGQLVAIGAYCLMKNHFHILVKEIKEGGISEFMEKISTAYAKYFNVKNSRVGPLFQSRYKSELVDSDEYLKYLYSYIHLNPIKDILKAGARKHDFYIKKNFSELDTFAYSSYLDYAGVDREVGQIIEVDAFPRYFISHESFKDNLRSWYVDI